MLKKTIKYTDYNGQEREETFRFHLKEAELLELEAGTTGGYTEMVKRIIAAKDTPAIMAIFKELLLKSYGEVSADGRRFIKSPELSEEFSQTEAYSKLFVELATDSDKAAEFVNGILPDTVQEAVAKQQNALEVVK